MNAGARASLPMYDWPEVREQTDAFWAAARGALLEKGVSAPDTLNRATGNMDLWQAPDLLLSQTCGWPLANFLTEQVAVVAIPTYNVEGCGAGTYRSALIARHEGDPLALAKGRVAINGRDSLSGYRALVNSLAKGGVTARDVGAWVETGSHRNSVKAVAEGRADLAAIDAVSWQLALDHEPAARKLVVVGWTDILPALPFVTANATVARVPDLFDALQHALHKAPQPYLAGLQRGTLADYAKVRALKTG